MKVPKQEMTNGWSFFCCILWYNDKIHKLEDLNS